MTTTRLFAEPVSWIHIVGLISVSVRRREADLERVDESNSVNVLSLLL